MDKQDILSLRQFTDVLDNAPVAIYVSEKESRKLLYTNRLAREMFPEVNEKEAFCYTVAGFDNVCPFCRTEGMNRTQYTVREYKNPVSGRIYQLSGKLIDWAGRAAHIEYILDITEKKLEEQRQEQEEKELRMTLDNIACGLCIYQLEGDEIRPVFHNKSFFEITGYCEENIRQVEQATNYLNVHPEDVGILQEKLEKLILEGGVARATYRLWNDREKDYRWIHLDATLHIHEDGRKLLYGVYSEVGEQKRQEEYFRTLVKNLSGGVSVIRCEPDESLKLEYVSEGFAALLKRTIEETKSLFQEDVFAGVHPNDLEYNRNKMQRFIESGEEHCEFEARFRRSDGTYVWIRDHVSILQGLDGIRRLYCIITDISRAVSEREQMRRQYEDMILQHYRMSGPDTLILGHCNITKDRIIEVWDSADSGFLESFSKVRDSFFTSFAELITDPEERKAFLDIYLNEPLLKAFAENKIERVMNCFIRLPGEELGRYVRVKVSMVETPDTGDITGIMSVTDITDQIISERILHRLSVTSHDFVVDLDLAKDYYKVLTCNENAYRVPEPNGCYSKRVAYMAESVVVSRDREVYVHALSKEEMESRLSEKGLYTFAFSLVAENGDVRTKNMTVSAIDPRLKRVSIACTDITDSVSEQQSLLSMLSYTFELAGIINVSDRYFVMYTRQGILENLSPYISEDYDLTQRNFLEKYLEEEERERMRDQFSLDTMLKRLEESPKGYEFVFSYLWKGERRYKQINVIWGDRNREKICMVRADVTEILAAERQAKNALEEALSLAEEANRAKSDFLSSMSHDIRTPLNGIMGMTALASGHLDDREWLADCFRKISISAKHLHSLVNDVLDMSRIERNQISLNRMKISLPEMVEHLNMMLNPQAREAGLQYTSRTEQITHQTFYGDSLRINQILINLLSNAVKFTKEGGSVEFRVEETAPLHDPDAVRYRFTVSDTGIGMKDTFLEHVFDPFTRDDDVVRIEGTGLGLSIARGLTDLMNGSISVESRLGQGSVFTVELEFENAPDEAEPQEISAEGSPEDSAHRGLAGRCFLIAEDNELNADILCQILETQGARAVVKTDGRQAVEAFQEMAPGTFDAVLMDIQMPNMNGYEATRTIRALERPDAAAIPIIALTANAFAEDIRTALEAGMTAHVAKPVEVEVLLQTIHRTLAG